MFHVEQLPPTTWLEPQLTELDFSFSRLGVALPPEQREQFSRYLALLWREGQKFNLFSPKDLNRLASRHVLESVGWVFQLGFQPTGRGLYVGSGAGFPGIPIKILFPEFELFLVESIGKKAGFLNLAVRELGLKNAVVLRDRVENLARQEQFQQYFNFGFARAVAPLKKLLDWTSPLFRPGARFFAIKGGDLSAELQAVQPLLKSGKINLNLHDYFINFISNPEQFVERKVVEIEFRKE